MLSEIVLREAIVNDIPEICNLELVNFGVDAFSKQQINYLITKAKSNFVVVEYRNCLVGSMILLYRKNTKSLGLYSIVVDDMFRGKGIARKLLDLATSKAIELMKESIKLEVRVDNTNAIVFYEKYGFIKLNIIKSYYKDNMDALSMIKYL